METRTLPNMLRINKGTETRIIATILAFLRRHYDDGDGLEPTDTVLYGPSTSNQVGQAGQLFIYNIFLTCDCQKYIEVFLYYKIISFVFN